MKVEKLHIDRIRNLRDIEISPSEGVNVIYGENGQGKTNLLEAIWLFTGAKSFRAAKDSEFIPFFENWAELSLELKAVHEDSRLTLRYGEKKEITHNGCKLLDMRELAGVFEAVVFSPVHLSLITGNPSERRKTIDTVIGQIKPRYISVILEYQRLLMQRNTLLKDITFSSALMDTLDVWDTSLARCGSLISRIRQSYIDKLSIPMVEIYDDITSSKENIEISYQSSVGDVEISEELFRSRLLQERGNDIRLGVTSIGPHRDDVEIKVNKTLARTYASQGQQRSAVLAMKLGECAIMQEVTGEKPVVLLDDVMSELDDSRRDFLLNRLRDRQIFITCCDPRQVTEVERKYLIKDGRLIGD